MNIIVCIKQVPDTTEISINPETNTLVREGIESIINPFDEYALEEGLRIKERAGEGKVTVLSMGPPQAESALRECIARGADEAILLSDKRFAGSDTWATSRILEAGIRHIGEFDIILCGQQAIDGDTAQVGPGISVRIGIPQVAYVSEIIDLTQETCRVRRLVETGHEIYEMTLPCLITVVKEINEPRLASLRGKMKAKKTDITVWGLDELGISEEESGLKGSRTQVIEIFNPPKPEGGLKIEEEDTNLAVQKLYSLLHENSIL
ncbi:electron transfer flavoprotein subunit beta/FixA family protein [Planctomycetota bacterium]